MKLFFKALSLAMATGCIAVIASPSTFAQTPPTLSPDPAPLAAPDMSPDASGGGNQLSEDLESQPQTAEEVISAALDLTADQQSSIQAIFASYQPRIQESAMAYFESLEALNQVLIPTSESSEIVAVRNQVVANQQATYDLLFERNIAIRDVLNLEQREMINTAIRDLLDAVTTAQLPPVLEFPDNLIGQSAPAAVDGLVAEGWEVVVSTPSLIQLDRGDEQLDLEVNRAGNISGLSLR
ncbi:MAG: Spy/CpxP family protein refolding chaperone [Nodosilinea sp.]